MTDAEISRALALAIEWPESRVAVKGGTTVWCMEKRDGVGNGWRRFDYRAPAVIWPIAERYNCFPLLSEWGIWSVAIEHPITCTPIRVSADTAAKAVAIAVIECKA